MNKDGIGMRWIVVMTIVAVAAGYMLAMAGKQNRARLITAAAAQKQLEKRFEVHNQHEFLTARLANEKSATQLSYWSKTLHLTVHWRNQTKTRAWKNGLANYGEQKKDSKKTKKYSMRGPE